MLDPKKLREHINETAEKLKVKHFDLDVTTISDLESKRKDIQTQMQQLQNERNTQSKQIGIAKSKGEDATAILESVHQIKIELESKESEFNALKEQLDQLTHQIPNVPHDSVPAGQTEDDNVEVRQWGTPREFDFEVNDHVDVGEALGVLDFKSGSKVAGSRFAVMFDHAATLHRALIQFMLDTHIHEHGYTEVNVPYLVNETSLFSTGQLPKFAEDFFHTQGEHALSLIPTAEVPVTNIHRDTITAGDHVPIKYVCHSPCFRSEAGSYGRDTRGMIRMHQFEKVELVQLVKPEDSYDALEALTHHAETILQKLELPYRVVNLCGGDLGFSAAKTYDLEVWLPGQNKYREISSCSNFEDFQARRMQARWRDPAQKAPQLLHTLNGSALAVGRTLVAILENYQERDGSVVVPEVLRPYMRNVEKLTRFDSKVT